VLLEVIFVKNARATVILTKTARGILLVFRDLDMPVFPDAMERAVTAIFYGRDDACVPAP
jgi:hypothetical protein